ncbi:MAG: PRD domain-containing protein [Alphaproteobacteria bacterium]|jgi:uncharacterized protein YpuA (DUF1002 family)|nr:PRD domain-containing protein [Alphaproteobacteria bacterium]
MENKITEILTELKASFSENQKTCILQVMDNLSQNNINLHKVGKEHLTMFVNHLLVLFQRIDAKDFLQMEGIDIMFAEFKETSIAIAKKVSNLINNFFNTDISKSEIFLITTHIENILNQQE